MLKLIILGTANAIPNENHENTHLIIISDQRRVLIDCSGNPVVRLKKAGIDVNSLTDIFLTHFHPDHVGGIPSLLISMWLLGRSAPLNIYGLNHTIDRIETMMDLFGWDQWAGFFSLKINRLPADELHQALQDDGLTVYTAPVQHMIPAIGIRVESRQTSDVLAYSGDTQPCDAVVALAENADILIHEATGRHPGHSSAAQAGRMAAQASAKNLFLIHYDHLDQSLVSQAQKEFPGPVTRAEDFMTIEF
jgi:ribonuclease Z